MLRLSPHHVTAPGRSPRSGNVASTVAVEYDTTTSSAIVSSRIHPPVKLSRAFSNRLYLMGHRCCMTTTFSATISPVTLLTCVHYCEVYARRPSSNTLLLTTNLTPQLTLYVALRQKETKKKSFTIITPERQNQERPLWVRTTVVSTEGSSAVVNTG
jgi:hypothetical protein